MAEWLHGHFCRWEIEEITGVAVGVVVGVAETVGLEPWPAPYLHTISLICTLTLPPN